MKITNELLETELKIANRDFGLHDDDGNKTTHYELDTQKSGGRNHLILHDDREGVTRIIQAGTTKEIYTSLKTANHIIHLSKEVLKEKEGKDKKELTKSYYLQQLNQARKLLGANDTDMVFKRITEEEYNANLNMIMQCLDEIEKGIQNEKWD